VRRAKLAAMPERWRSIRPGDEKNAKVRVAGLAGRQELKLRAAGYVVLRYVWPQIVHQAGAVARDLAAAVLPSAA